MRTRIRLFTTLLAGCCTLLPQAPAPVAVPVQTDRDWGVNAATAETPNGRLRLSVPLQMHAGDEIVGTVYVEPVGTTDEERSKNSDELRGYVWAPSGGQTTGNRLRFTVPAGLAAMPFVLSKDGKEVARVTVPVSDQRHPRPSESGPPKPGSFRTPEIIQAGRPLSIQGPISDDMEVMLGPKKPEFLCQSPREIVVMSPAEELGPAQLILHVRGLTIQRPVHNLGLSASVPTTKLARGQSTTAVFRVSGGQSLKKDVVLRLENRTPNVVRLQGGNAQDIRIRPGDFKGAGIATATLNRRVTGVTAGAFYLVAKAVPTVTLGCCETNVRLAQDQPYIIWSTTSQSRDNLTVMEMSMSLMIDHACALDSKLSCRVFYGVELKGGQWLEETAPGKWNPVRGVDELIINTPPGSSPCDGQSYQVWWPFTYRAVISSTRTLQNQGLLLHLNMAVNKGASYALKLPIDVPSVESAIPVPPRVGKGTLTGR